MYTFTSTPNDAYQYELHACARQTLRTGIPSTLSIVVWQCRTRRLLSTMEAFPRQKCITRPSLDDSSTHKN